MAVCILLLLVFSSIAIVNANKSFSRTSGFEYPSGTTIVPMGADQGSLREAYKSLFNKVYKGGNVEWSTATSSYVQTTDAYIVPKAYSLHPIDIAVLRSSITNDGQYVTWEDVYFESLFRTYLWGDYFDTVTEEEIRDGALDDYDLLIIPATIEIYDFVLNGGFLYAQGKSMYIAESAGLITDGTVLLDERVTADNNTASLNVLNEPLLNASDSDTVIAEYSSGLILSLCQGIHLRRQSTSQWSWMQFYLQWLRKGTSGVR